MDKTILKDVKHAEQLLRSLARQADAPVHIQALAAKEIALEGKMLLHAEVFFLTEKQHEDGLVERVKNWIGIKGQPPGGDLFSGKVSGNVAVGEAMVLNVQWYHFDHYPMKRLSEDKKALKIIIYDPEYKEHYKNWHLAEQILGKDPAVCVAVNTRSETEPAEENRLNTESLYRRDLSLESLG
ncbi:MAG: hypothetical protein KDD04_09670, partial [Sinomicrobium sp.]|nr:hypothetical protein [Sinomicrobium sp.]